METIKLEDTKIEDASYSLQTLMRTLVWLEKNGWKMAQTTEGDLIGLGCGIYKNSKSADIHIHMIRKSDNNSYLFEDKTTIKKL